MQQQRRLSYVSRRTILKGSLGLLSLALPPVLKSDEAGAKNVWGGLTQEELDAAYSQGNWAPNWEEVWARFVVNSETARSRLGDPTVFRYGDGDDETLEIYATGKSDSPIQVFVHGGAWFTGDAARHGFLAENFVDHGAHFIAINYASVDDTDGRLMPLADQVRRAIAWVHANAARFGGDGDRVFLSGHSAGAHLAAVALTTDWQNQFGLPADVVKGGLLCSGMFDLEPVSLSERREYVRFDEQTVEALSPQRHLDRIVSPLIVAYGSLESPEFQRQSREFAAAALKHGKPVDLLRAENYNHFEIIETMASPYGLLGYHALRQMGLG